MLEFAIWAVALLLLTVGLFYAAQMLYAYAVANFGAAEALGLDSGQLTVTPTWPTNENQGSQEGFRVAVEA
ncbi:MAG: hypothetical protein WA005_09810 [Candidatus Binataceae bacterium]